MKYSIIISEKELLKDSDKITWIGISKKLDQKKTDATESLKNVIKLISLQFPELPNKMVWGNYLIFEEYEKIVVIDIDYENIDSIKNEILNIVLNEDLAVLIGKENKIYRDISEIKN
ncbi:hypothetical protein [Algibacter lectus]|uniref:hypothetical protein n=1 Tax=Algibacter lectus TaxID=221126 RepID=UPI002494B646|nr:hypothetical protein [Algibacter lectus]